MDASGGRPLLSWLTRPAADGKYYFDTANPCYALWLACLFDVLLYDGGHTTIMGDFWKMLAEGTDFPDINDMSSEGSGYSRTPAVHGMRRLIVRRMKQKLPGNPQRVPGEFFERCRNDTQADRAHCIVRECETIPRRNSSTHFWIGFSQPDGCRTLASVRSHWLQPEARVSVYALYYTVHFELAVYGNNASVKNVHVKQM